MGLMTNTEGSCDRGILETARRPGLLKPWLSKVGRSAACERAGGVLERQPLMVAEQMSCPLRGYDLTVGKYI